MRRRVMIGLLLLGAARAWSEVDPVPFAPVLPPGVVDVSGWEVVTGEFETTRARGAYRFYVNPKLQGIYQLMRYQVRLLTPAPGLESSRSSAERVVFVGQPGSRRSWQLFVAEPDELDRVLPGLTILSSASVGSI